MSFNCFKSRRFWVKLRMTVVLLFWTCFCHSGFASVIPDLLRNLWVSTALKVEDSESSSEWLLSYCFGLAFVIPLASVIPDLLRNLWVSTALKVEDSESSSEWLLSYCFGLASVIPDSLRNLWVSTALKVEDSESSSEWLLSYCFGLASAFRTRFCIPSLSQAQGTDTESHKLEN